MQKNKKVNPDLMALFCCNLHKNQSKSEKNNFNWSNTLKLDQ